MNDNMLETAGLLMECDAKVKELETMLEAAKEERDTVNQELAEAMGECEVQSFHYRGKTFFLATRPRVGYRKEEEEAFFTALRANGWADLIRPTVNSNTLTAAVIKEIAGEDADGNRLLPDWIAPYLTVFEKPIVNMRKG